MKMLDHIPHDVLEIELRFSGLSTHNCRQSVSHTEKQGFPKSTEEASRKALGLGRCSKLLINQ